MTKLVKESLNERDESWMDDETKAFWAKSDANKIEFEKKYPQIRQLAKDLEKRLGIKLVELSEDEQGDELIVDDETNEEIASKLFSIRDKRVKPDEDEPFCIALDEHNGFQFFLGSQTLGTSIHRKKGIDGPLYNLIPVPIDVSLLTKKIYDEVVRSLNEE